MLVPGPPRLTASDMHAGMGLGYLKMQSNPFVYAFSTFGGMRASEASTRVPFQALSKLHHLLLSRLQPMSLSLAMQPFPWPAKTNDMVSVATRWSCTTCLNFRHHVLL